MRASCSSVFHAIMLIMLIIGYNLKFARDSLNRIGKKWSEVDRTGQNWKKRTLIDFLSLRFCLARIGHISFRFALP